MNRKKFDYGSIEEEFNGGIRIGLRDFGLRIEYRSRDAPLGDFSITGGLHGFAATKKLANVTSCTTSSYLVETTVDLGQLARARTLASLMA
ncbi:hypothetical protein E1B28_003772 [Marasmius oreades]|uniref:Uncharacterized protein n=1 Tax=Marasmius oreades TaxID=181124 RepID=A0A9P8ABT2_9AGAR|nr:uncharacterized protein E1B28_003772 [Marasmius oreades]KAG7096328.1 hypothetical protein E1B28_003772 [Marasmius oreades]